MTVCKPCNIEVTEYFIGVLLQDDNGIWQGCLTFDRREDGRYSSEPDGLFPLDIDEEAVFKACREAVVAQHPDVKFV